MNTQRDFKVGGSMAPSTRDPWIIAAAAASVGSGVNGAVAAAMTFLGIGFGTVLVLALGACGLAVTAGIGLLWLRPWARLGAGVVAALSLYLYASGLIVAVLASTLPPWSLFDWISGPGSLVVICAIARRWPPGSAVS